MVGLGMAPSADIGDENAVFQPCHGSAPDIAGQGIANPIAQILSASMLLRFSFGLGEAADAIDAAVKAAIDEGFRTGDIFTGAEGTQKVGTVEMGDVFVGKL